MSATPGPARVALVTGCRSGFGLLIAVELARRGFVVYAGLRDVSTAGDLAAATVALPVHPVQLDVTQAEQRDAVVARILAEHGRVDALVNNAGIAIGGFLEQLAEADLRAQLEVNLFAVWALTNAVLPTMRAQGSGVVVNISSVSGRIAIPGLGGYATSKFALEGMTEALRHEVAPFGIGVALVEPGPYTTDIFGRNRRIAEAAQDPDDPYAARTARLEQLADKANATAGDPVDVALRVAALCQARGFALRHPMGTSARVRLWIRRWLPFGLWEWALAKATAPRG